MRSPLRFFRKMGAKRAALKANKYDPTNTLVLRTTFVNDFTRRFKELIKLSNYSIVNNDCFGLRGSKYTSIMSIRYLSRMPDGYPVISYRDFDDYTSSEKIDAYMEWLDLGIEHYLYAGTVPVDKKVEDLWLNAYLGTAYKHGILWGRRKLRGNTKTRKALGISREDIDVTNEAVSTAFGDAVHVERVKSIYSRAFTDLEGITAAMEAQVKRVLSDGIVSGKNPFTIAKEITDRIESIGLHRSTLLARTEVIRAHHLASIQVYRNYGVENVSVEAEWNTAGDGRVCTICAPLDGKIFTLDEIELMIPAHPQCRCGAIPVVVAKSEGKGN